LYTLVNKAQPNEYRYKQIDSLRGIAALLVIWLHVSELYINLSPQVKIAGSFFYDFPWHINTGLIGVNIFFAISGFVLLKSIKGPKRAATKLFFTRRFFRLYPAFWLSVLLGYYVMSLMGKHFSAGEIIANLTMLPQLLHHKVILGLYWTLQIEIIFYFIAWLMFIFDKLHNPLHLFLSSIFFLTIYITSKILIYFNVQQIESMITPFCLAIMFWGGMFITQKAYQKIGLYRLDYHYAMDSEWCHRAIEAGLNFHYIPHVLTSMRLGGVSDLHFKKSISEYRQSVVDHHLASSFAAGIYFYFFLFMRYLMNNRLIWKLVRWLTK